MAKLVKVKVDAYKCDKCGTLHLLKDGKLPVRCSNRKECGEMFDKDGVAGHGKLR